MTRGFYTILAAQFFSSLADNALFVIAVEWLLLGGAAEWQRAALVPMFALFYVLLAPWVGAFADSRPKGQVMFASNAVKIGGCLILLFGSHPLLAYAVVGLGAAAYSPAKYGILTELLPSSLLVRANGWMEGFTVASIILGVVFGGLLISPQWAELLSWLGWGASGRIASSPAGSAVVVIVLVYGLAALFNLGIPRTRTRLRALRWRSAALLLPHFWHCNLRLWRDPTGQVSLAATTLLWGVSGNMRYIVLAWAALALGYATSSSAALVGVVAVGMALGAAAAAVIVRLENAFVVLPLGFLLGAAVLAMAWVHHVGLAVLLLVLVGALGGFIVVPMNALLQHRGHLLVGAGRSIAVQNFNEQACILFLGVLYSLAAGLGLSALGATALFGAIVVVGVAGILAWLRRNGRRQSPS